MPMPKKYHTRGKFRATIWTPVILSILTIALGIVLSEIQTRTGWLILLVALGICLFIFFLSLMMFIHQVYPSSFELLEQLQSRIDQLVEKGAITWLLTNEQLVEFEKNIEVDEIWLVTNDLAADIPGSLFYDIVSTNLKRGIKYKYFIPRSFSAEARGQQLIENHRGRGDISVIHLSDDFFFLGPRLDFAIYDPSNCFHKRCGYMQVPVDSVERLHARLDADLIDQLIGKLHTFIDNSEEEKLRSASNI